MDWGHNTGCIVNEQSKVVKPKFKSTDTILIETGCPKYNILKNNCKILVVDAAKIKEFRDKNKVEKSHENDAKLILEFYKKYPKQFKLLTQKEKKELELLIKFKHYETIMKQTARMKNINWAAKNEYGTKSIFVKALEEGEEGKKQLMKEFTKHFKKQLTKVNDIKGIGIRYLAGILLYAHPRRFPCISAYLAYCGYKGSRVKKKGQQAKYHHNVKSMYNQIVDGVIKNHKRQPNAKFCKMYVDFKKQFQKKQPDWTKGHVEGVTKNRVATFICKEIYQRFHNEG